MHHARDRETGRGQSLKAIPCIFEDVEVATCMPALPMEADMDRSHPRSILTKHVLCYVPTRTV